MSLNYNIRWCIWETPDRSGFNSDDDYFNHLDEMRCESCGMKLIPGDIHGLVPYQSELETNKKVIDARIVHKYCYEKE